MGATIAYCRVSSRDQNPGLQLDALDTHGYDRLFAETESGKRGVQRPEFTAALSALQPGDTLVFWKSDRWGRSAAHVLTTIGELRDRGVRVKSLTENFDLDTKEGRFMFAVLAAAAEYELELRAERQAEGRMLPGRKHIGRPKVTGPAEIATLRRLVADGASVTQAARTLNLPLHRVRRTRHHTLTRRKVPPATRHARDIRRDGFGRAGSARRTPDFSAPGPGVSSQTVIARRSPTRDIRRSVADLETVRLLSLLHRRIDLY
jgi:DNA invertase Pin-like site-specific DNA recombinase